MENAKTVRTHIISAVFAGRSTTENTEGCMSRSVTNHIIGGGDVHVWRYTNSADDGYVDELLTVVALLSQESRGGSRAGESVYACHEITNHLMRFNDDAGCGCCD